MKEAWTYDCSTRQGMFGHVRTPGPTCPTQQQPANTAPNPHTPSWWQHLGVLDQQLALAGAVQGEAVMVQHALQGRGRGGAEQGWARWERLAGMLGLLHSGWLLGADPVPLQAQLDFLPNRKPPPSPHLLRGQHHRQVLVLLGQLLQLQHQLGGGLVGGNHQARHGAAQLLQSLQGALGVGGEEGGQR